MKKSIKYAGIAAATLLTVAPIAAPVVSQTTTVQADASDAQTSASQLENSLNDFDDLFGDKDASVFATQISAAGDAFKLGSSKAMTYSNFLTDATYKALTDGQTAGKEDSVLSSITQDNDARMRDIYVTAAKDGGAAITKNADLVKILNDSSQPEVVFTVHYTYTDTNNNVVTSRSTSFKATRENDADITKATATFTTPFNVALNQTVTDSQLISGTDFSIKDQNGDGIVTKTVSPSAVYYKTYQAAIEHQAADNNGTSGSLSSDEIKTSDNKAPKFIKAGTYYQPIIVEADKSSELGQYIEDFLDDPTANPIYVNGKVASEGYDFTIEQGEGTKPDKIIFVRTVNVSSDTSQWTVTENKGIVTTKADTPYYTLVNDNNAKITNRALAKNTAWVTDQKRVDQNGNTQYRVATGEWIDANNVTFSDKATTDEGAYTDEQALNGKVTLDGPSSFIYMLYNDNGENISNRALAGDSEWYTDKKATNAAGVTVYHVATGEWVQAGNGVNYSAY